MKFPFASEQEPMRTRPSGTQINLEQAIATLIQNQAAMMANLAAFLTSSREIQEWRMKTDERLARIERDLEQIKIILGQLPELIRQKIGFKAK